MTLSLTMPMEAMTNFLIGLLNIPSPTGYHAEAIAYTGRAFDELNIPSLEIQETRKGALMLTWRGKSSERPVGLTAHVDTLGFMVKDINANGSLKLTNLGGISWPGSEFENCTVRTFDNQRYRGTILLNNPSTHVNREAQTKPRNEDTMELRLDARTTSREQTLALGIGVGDFVFVDPRIEQIDTGFIRSRFLDDKAGVAVIYGALMALRDAGQTPSQDAHILITNYEEVGHGGAAGWPVNLVELLAIDMGALGSGQTGDEFSCSICAKDAGGPYHWDMVGKLRRLAEAHNIAYKVDIYPYYSSDGTAYWRAGGEARVGLIGPGVASSHGYERMHQEALDHSAHLIARYLIEA